MKNKKKVLILFVLTSIMQGCVKNSEYEINYNDVHSLANNKTINRLINKFNLQLSKKDEHIKIYRNNDSTIYLEDTKWSVNLTFFKQKIQSYDNINLELSELYKQNNNTDSTIADEMNLDTVYSAFNYDIDTISLYILYGLMNKEEIYFMSMDK